MAGPLFTYASQCPLFTHAVAIVYIHETKDVAIPFARSAALLAPAVAILYIHEIQDVATFYIR